MNASVSSASGSPAPSEEECAQRRIDLVSRCRVDLWKAVWEAGQVMTYEDIRALVESTITEIQTDEP